MARVKLPPGFRFHPTDIELVTYYLKRKVHGRAIEFDIVAEIDVYKCEPWDLPEKSLLGSSDPEWYFFSALDKKYANGSRTNRSTESGYWKATGKDRAVKTGSHTVGMKKTLVFYKGRAPHGGRTNWVMHEYRLEDDKSRSAKLQDTFVLCRVFKKNGIGPNHAQSSTPFDFEEETGGTTTEGVTASVEKPLMSGLEVVPSSIDGSTKENDASHSEMKDTRTVSNEKYTSGAPSSTFTSPEETDNDMSLFYDLLLNDSNQYLDNFTTMKQSTFKVESLYTVLETEGLASPISAEDVTLWLEAPTLLGDLNAHALSGNQLCVFPEYYSPEEADMLNQLYHSTLQSQEFEMATQHVGTSTLSSKYAMQMSTLSKTVSGNDITEVHNDVVMDKFSTLSEQNFSEETQTLSSKLVSGLEDISEAEMLEELFQLINQSKGKGQQSQVEGTEFQGEGATSGVEDDVFFDDLREPNAEEWMQTDLFYEASASHDWNEGSLGPTGSRLEDWLSESLSSSSDSPFSEIVPELLGSDALTQTLHSSYDGQGQTVTQNETKPPLFPLVDSSTTTTKAHMYSLPNSSSKISKPLSRFSRLLDSVPVLPASAAEIPPHVDKRNFVPYDNPVGNSGRVQSSMQTTSWNVRFRAFTNRCGCEFMSGLSKSPTLRLKQQILTSEDKSLLSLSAPIVDMTLSKDSGKGCNFRRRGNGCYSLMFFLGPLSAVFWFLLLPLAWRFASHVVSLLV